MHSATVSGQLGPAKTIGDFVINNIKKLEINFEHNVLQIQNNEKTYEFELSCLNTITDTISSATEHTFAINTLT